MEVVTMEKILMFEIENSLSSMWFPAKKINVVFDDIQLLEFEQTETR